MARNITPVGTIDNGNTMVYKYSDSDRPTREDLIKLLENCKKEGWDGDYYFCPACYIEVSSSDVGTGWSLKCIGHANGYWIAERLKETR